MKETEKSLENASNRKQHRVKGNYISTFSELNRIIYPTILRVAKPVKKTLQEIAEQALLEQFAPAAVLVNASGNVLYIHGRTGLYLELAPGYAGVSNIIMMARKGLQKPLVSALHKAVSKQITVTTSGLRVPVNNIFIRVDLIVSPLGKKFQAGSDTELYLIIIAEQEPAIEESEIEKNMEGLSPPAGFNNRAELLITNDVNSKKAELEKLSEVLQTTRDELLASQEALKRFNKYLEEAKTELKTVADNIEIKKDEIVALDQKIDFARVEFEAANRAPETNNHELTEFKTELEKIKVELLNANEELRIKEFELKKTKDELLSNNEELRKKEFQLEKINNELVSISEDLRTKKTELEEINDELLSINEDLRIKKIAFKKTSDELLSTNEALNEKNMELEMINHELIITDQKLGADKKTLDKTNERLASANSRQLAMGVKQKEINDLQTDLHKAFKPIPASPELDVLESNQAVPFVNYQSPDEFKLNESSASLSADSNVLGETSSELVFIDVSEFNRAAIHGFRHDSSITSVSIPEGVERLKRSMFYKCENLETVMLPVTLKFIDDFVFYGCEKLFNISIENSEALEYIGTSAFEGCISLEKLKLPSSTVEIEAAAFLGCKKLEVIDFRENSQLEIIGSHAFKDCVSIKRLVLPENLKQLGMSIFYGCHKLESITLPNKLEVIGENAFWGCDSLTEIFVANKKLAKQPGFTIGLPPEIKLKF